MFYTVGIVNYDDGQVQGILKVFQVKSAISTLLQSFLPSVILQKTSLNMTGNKLLIYKKQVENNLGKKNPYAN